MLTEYCWLRYKPRYGYLLWGKLPALVVQQNELYTFYMRIANHPSLFFIESSKYDFITELLAFILLITLFNSTLLGTTKTVFNRNIFLYNGVLRYICQIWSKSNKLFVDAKFFDEQHTKHWFRRVFRYKCKI